MAFGGVGELLPDSSAAGGGADALDRRIRDVLDDSRRGRVSLAMVIHSPESTGESDDLGGPRGDVEVSVTTGSMVGRAHGARSPKAPPRAIDRPAEHRRAEVESRRLSSIEKFIICK